MVCCFFLPLTYIYRKNIMKYILLCGLLLTTLITFSQKKADVKFNIGPELFTPVGNLMDTHFTGIGGMVEMEVLPVKHKVGYVLVTGYDYIMGKNENQSLFQAPGLVGVRAHLDSTISIAQMAGVSFFNQNEGFKQTFCTSVRFDIGKLGVEGKYITALRPGHDNDISGFVLRLSYIIK
jgi:hypothetical protein